MHTSLKQRAMPATPPFSGAADPDQVAEPNHDPTTHGVRPPREITSLPIGALPVAKRRPLPKAPAPLYAHAAVSAGLPLFAGTSNRTEVAGIGATGPRNPLRAADVDRSLALVIRRASC
jgi:hypothetical protein